ncbi:uncharacterized protein [Lepeophtheirus salmonis]|uniref:uncharacterized protein n=1 Tax=Lepeophtheirus salmonis TaxID=72036 RepID=UPI001AE228C0|nr:protein glass-like [Lepeophtheirus salmonis]XP_040564747.1 protein glass-like [Lepeophtheirus salmonis]XP_040564748.1 protein glass-like [Lepeophtheirus salmonis]
MNFGSSSTGSSNPPPPPAGAYYSYGGSPYSPVYSNQSSNYGYSPSSWPPPPPGDGDDPKKDPAFVYNGYGGAESNPDPNSFRPPSEEEKSSSDSRPVGEDDKNSNDLIVPSSVNSGHEPENSSSPLGSNEDSSSSLTHKGCMDEDKKSSLDFRPHESHELLSDLSKFDEKHHHHPQQTDILSNNNNDEYQLGNELEKAHGAVLPYDHHNPHLNQDDWLAANQHLPGSGASMQQHTFPMGMGGYGQQPAQQAQQPMWNYYNSYSPAGHHTPHQDRFMDSPWWNYAPPPPHGPPPHPPQQQQSPHPPGLQPPGAWALRGPRPSSRGGSERRGPGRPRLSASNKVPGSPGGGGDSSSSASSPLSRPRIPVSPLNSQFPSPYSSSELSPGEDQSDANRKRGPGRPRIGMVDGLDSSSGIGGNILEELGPQHPPTSHTPVNNHGPVPTGNGGGATGTGGGKSKGSSSSTNSNKKRYVCEICQKRFSTAWYVRVHRKSHNGERPYICHNCGKGFMLPNVLQVHLRKCEKTANIRPEGLNSPQVRPTNISPGSGGGLPNSNTNSNNNNHHHAQDSGSPLPQHGVPYPDIYGGLYNQRFQPPPPEPMSYNMHHAHQDPGQQQTAAAAHLHAASLSNYESISSLPGGPGGGSGGFPNDRSPYGSPLFSPSHHFLANDRPPDKGGGSATSATSPSLLSRLPPSFPLRCPTCDSVFETQSGLEDHYPCSSFSCSICDKSFSDKGELDAHLHSCHGITCPVCSERFPFKSSLLSHIKITHEKFYLENQQVLGISGANGGGVGSPSGLKTAATLLMESEESGDRASPNCNNNNNNSSSGSTGDLSSKIQQTPLAMS